MFRFSLVFIIFGICIFETNANAIGNLQEFSNNTLFSYICDDELLKSMDKRLEQLSAANELFQTKFELMRIKQEQQDNERNAIIASELNKIKNDLTSSQSKHDIDLKLPVDCAEAVPTGGHSGVYRIQLNPKSKSFYVYCQVDPDNGDAWTVVQKREDGSIDFYRNWADYKEGFGNLAGEYFLGLDKLHALTQSSLHELWVQMEDFENVKRYAKYDAFAIGDEQQAYALNVLGKFKGDGGDSLRFQQGHKFTTKDMDNDNDGGNCAITFLGAWWYAACHASNLNGKYLRGEYPKDQYAKGVDWDTFHGHYYSLKYVHMAVRRVK